VTIEEKTPLLAVVEHGHEAAFDVLLKFCPMVDINIVCCDWKIEGLYSMATALDKAFVSKHKWAPLMLERLISLGAKSADDLPRTARENPFLKFEEHFPSARLSNLEMKDIEYFKSMASKPGHLLTEPSARNNVTVARPWSWPDTPNGDQALQGVIATIKEHLTLSRVNTIEEQRRLIRQLFLEWHPDKQLESQSLATKVFPWLQELRQKIL